MRNPQREISKGFIAAIITIVICSTLTIYFVASLNKNITAPIDYPISHTLALLYGHNSFIARCVDILGLCGLLASLNGITIGYSRQTYALARRDYLPKFLTQMSKKGVPYAALLIPGILGLLACSSAKFSNSLIILAAFGAVTMYCIALLSLFVLRVRHPELNRPFKVFYPWVPVCGLFLGVICWYSILRYAILPNSMMLLDHRVPLLDVLASIYIIAIFYYFARRLRYPIAT